MGRYVLTPEIFDHLEKGEVGAGGEIQLTDAIRAVAEGGGDVHAVDFEGRRYDVGGQDRIRQDDDIYNKGRSFLMFLN